MVMVWAGHRHQPLLLVQKPGEPAHVKPAKQCDAPGLGRPSHGVCHGCMVAALGGEPSTTGVHQRRRKAATLRTKLMQQAMGNLPVHWLP